MMTWYAIRTVYAFGTKDDGTNVFEERIVAFEAPTWGEAHAKARVESAAYAADLDLEAHPDQIGYEQDGSPLIDGYELWSQLFESRLELSEFYGSRYSSCEYSPDPRPNNSFKPKPLRGSA